MRGDTESFQKHNWTCWFMRQFMPYMGQMQIIPRYVHASAFINLYINANFRNNYQMV